MRDLVCWRFSGAADVARAARYVQVGTAWEPSEPVPQTLVRQAVSIQVPREGHVLALFIDNGRTFIDKGRKEGCVEPRARPA